jgi:predicted HicB family RNase H-like nuclease
MTSYVLNLPLDLKREAEEIAKRQGISLNQFIILAVSEKIALLKQQLAKEHRQSDEKRQRKKE